MNALRQAFGFRKSVLDPPPKSVTTYHPLTPYSFPHSLSQNNSAFASALACFGSIRRACEVAAACTGFEPATLHVVAQYLMYTEREFEHAAQAAELVVELSHAQEVKALDTIKTRLRAGSKDKHKESDEHLCKAVPAYWKERLLQPNVLQFLATPAPSSTASSASSSSSSSSSSSAYTDDGTTVWCTNALALGHLRRVAMELYSGDRFDNEMKYLHSRVEASTYTAGELSPLALSAAKVAFDAASSEERWQRVDADTRLLWTLPHHYLRGVIDPYDDSRQYFLNGSSGSGKQTTGDFINIEFVTVQLSPFPHRAVRVCASSNSKEFAHYTLCDPFRDLLEHAFKLSS